MDILTDAFANLGLLRRQADTSALADGRRLSTT